MNESTHQRVVIFAPRSTIGHAVANEVIASGGQIALVGRSLDGIDMDAAFTETCQLSDFDAVEDAMAGALDALGGVTGVVNCSGSMMLKPAHQCSREDYDTTLEANLATAFAVTRAAGKNLSKSGGSVVLISSAAASLGMPNHELVGASKSAVEGLVRSAAATYASRGIRFNAVAPGLVETNLTRKLVSNETSLKVSQSLHALGRIGAPADIARTICWLLDPAQAWVTGQTFNIDGGLSRVQPRPKVSMK